MATLRRALAQAASADERDCVVFEIVELAGELSQSGDEEAALARLGLDEALTQLTAAPEHGDDDGARLYLTAMACLRRDSDSDLDDAIGCLTDLRAMLLASPSEPGDADAAEILIDIEVKLGMARFERASRPEGSGADVDAAATALQAALDRVADDDERHPELVAMLALQYATRYVGFGGSEDHRAAAVGHASAGLESPSAAETVIAACHIVVAWMALTRQLTAGQRSSMLRRSDIETARRGGPEAAAMLAGLGTVEIAVGDAEAALGHLRQVGEAAVTDEWLLDLVAVLATMALLAIMRNGGPTEDIDRVADGLQRAARRPWLQAPERGELLAMRAALLATGNDPDERPDTLKPTAHALQEAAARLPENHLMREPLLDQLRVALGHQVAAAESADDLVAEVEQIVDTMEQMPHDAQFARTLMFTAVRILSLRLSHRAAVPLDRISAQLERARSRLALNDPVRPLIENMYWGTIGTLGSIQNRLDLLEQATDGLIRCADETPADGIGRPLVLQGVAFALVERYAMTGELRHLDQAEEYLAKATATQTAVIGGPAEPGPGYAMVLYLRSLVQLARAQYDAEGQDPAVPVAQLEQALSLTEPGHPLRPRLVASLETARVVQELRARRLGSPSLGRAERHSFETILAEARSMRRDHADFPAMTAQAAAGLMLRGIADGDTAAMTQAVSLLAEACSVPGLTYRERPQLLTMHGSALLTRYHLARDPRDLSYAIDRLEEARRAVEQVLGSPYTAEVLQSLASAYRARGDATRGDVSRAVTLGLDALRERAGDVLLQDSDGNALAVARRVTNDAGEMARWFLQRDQASAAIEALELGRGTVLHAATSGTGLAEALQGAGRADLAADWARAMSRGTPQSDAINELRSEIMRAIEGSTAEARLLAPPPVADIGAALREGGADALVYLLPRNEDGPGVAVLVDSGGTVRRLPLPGLYTGAGSPATGCLRARRAAEAAGTSPTAAAATSAWHEALGELCDWAWRAAIGPVLAAVPGRRGWPHIVLVPGGELGLVAWHAARRGAGRGYRYAIQEAVISYASSARQFVDGAARRPRPWAQAPVLISDAAASAYSTELGICHLYTEHYPAASVFGHAHERLTSGGRRRIPGSSAARSADVLAALAHAAVPGASLLHFGCHGQAEVPVLNSRLKLGGQNSVAVADILRRARTGPRTVSGGLVVLASCLTDVAEADYDEALTLATAFLSAGASGVVAARWQVPDSDTALVMAVFHRLLNGSDPAPARALRSAQLWMLDPARSAPGPLPRVLRDEVGRPGLAGPAAWAGFGYQGQLRAVRPTLRQAR